LGRLRQKNFEFKANLGYIARTPLEKIKGEGKDKSTYGTKQVP
jgi:hypothetical protein